MAIVKNSENDYDDGGGKKLLIKCFVYSSKYQRLFRKCVINYSLTILYFIFIILHFLHFSSAHETILLSEHDFHNSLTSEERLILLGHQSEVPIYDFIASPKALNFKGTLNRRRRSIVSSSSLSPPISSSSSLLPSSSFSSSSSSSFHNPPTTVDATLTGNAPVTIEFYAFEQNFRLSLRPNHQLLSPSFRMINEIRGNDLGKNDKKNTTNTVTFDEQKLSILENCFYQGVAETHPGSAVAVSLCNGMQGVIETHNGVYVVTPLPQHTVERYRVLKKSNSSLSFFTTDSGILAGKYHIVLKHNDDEFNDYKCPHHRKKLSMSTSTKPAFLQHVHAAFESVRLNRDRRSIIKNTDSEDSAENVELNDLEIDSMNPKQPILYEEHKSRGSADVNKHRVSIQTNDTSNEDKTVLQVLTSGLPSTNKIARVEGEDRFNITVETAVFVDESLYHLLSKTFPVDTEQQIVLYVLTIMNAVQLLFKQPSIGRSVEISVVLMDLLKTQPKNLHPSDNIDTYLTNFCVWQHKKRLKESGGPTPDWDHALLLSGINMYVVDSKGRRKRHVVGLAPVSGMCNSLNSCTISEGTSFQTVLVAGHEMGHSLGMEHDGSQDDNTCNKDDFVMSPTLGPGKTTWSYCSKNYLDKFVLTSQATCVLGRSAHVNIIQQFIPHNQLPGERFSVDDQCRFRFGPTAKHFTGQKKTDICRMIKCHVKPNRRKDSSGPHSYYGRSLYNPYPPKSTYNTHPALEGTECGENMWCHEGQCIDKLKSIEAFESPSSNDVEDIPIIKEIPATSTYNSNPSAITTINVTSSYSETSPKTDLNRIRIDNNNNNSNNNRSTNNIIIINNSNNDININNKLNLSRTRPHVRNPYQFKYNPPLSPITTTQNPIIFVQDSNSTEISVDYISTSKLNPYNSASQTTPIIPNNRHSWRSSRISAKPKLPVNGSWSSWTNFGPCISECLIADSTALLPIGVQTSLRKCNFPSPQNGGTECRGPDIKVKLCNAFKTCSVESSISAASPETRQKFDANDPRAIHNLRYRLRTVEDFIDDTCTAAALHNDKLENHGTQYPNYDSASHSCYVWCHKKGGGYVSQGWRLPDGTPCGRNNNSTFGITDPEKLSSSGYCYNGQCRPFNCLGETFMKSSSASHASSNVYSGFSSTFATKYGNFGSYQNINNNRINFTNEESLDCSQIDHELDQLLNPGHQIDNSHSTIPIDDDSYSLIKIDLKTKILKSKAKQKIPAISDGSNAYSLSPPSHVPVTTTPVSVLPVSATPSILPEPILSVPDLFGPAAQNFYSSNSGFLSTVSPNQFNLLGGNWSSWHPVTECQYSTSCVKSGRGFRLVTRECQRANTCLGRREALQVCSAEISGSTLGLYEQYCPVHKRKSSEQYSKEICKNYQIKYPNLLSGSGRQLKSKNAGCIVACEDRLWKDVHYQMDAFEDGKFPFGTDCSDSELGQGYCLNGKCIRFDSTSVSYDTDESVLQRNEILQLFAPASMYGNTGAFAGFSNTDLYSSISNELYKRANTHSTGQTYHSPLSVPVNVASSVSEIIPETSIIRNSVPHSITNHVPYVSPTQLSSHSHAQSSEVNIPNDYDQLTYQVRRNPSHDLYSSATHHSTFRRIKRSAYSRSHLRKSRGFNSNKNNIKLGSLSQFDNSASSNIDPQNSFLFRKTSAQEYSDPESDYVSWRLVRTQRNSPIHYTSPIIKKPLKPITLTQFSPNLKKQSSSGFQKTIPEHFKTFILVKHNKNPNSWRNWRTNFMPNQQAIPLGNQTRFLDDDDEEENEGTEGKIERKLEEGKEEDDEGEDEEEEEEEGEEEEGEGESEREEENDRKNNQNVKNQEIIKVNNEDVENEEAQTKVPFQKKKNRKNPNQFGLGHESWPESETENNSQGSTPKMPILRTSGGTRIRELRVEPYIWSVILSECSRPCGDGIRTVGVVCTVGQKTVDDRFCDPEQKPMHKHIEPCKERECIGSWRSEPWSACSSKCSSVPISSRNSFQSRNIVCVGPVIFTAPSSMLGGSNMTTNPRLFSILSHKYCDADSKPVQWKACDAESLLRDC